MGARFLTKLHLGHLGFSPLDSVKRKKTRNPILSTPLVSSHQHLLDGADSAFRNYMWECSTSEDGYGVRGIILDQAAPSLFCVGVMLCRW
jgi:hypothetical protein